MSVGETRILLEADLHTGSKTGITTNAQNALQRQLLERRQDCVSHFKRPDIVVMNGDGIDGTDPKGNDVDETDMFQQAERCAELMHQWNAKDEYIVVAGTHYHTSLKGQPMDKAIVAHLKWLVKGKDIKVSYRRKLKTTFGLDHWFLLEMRHKIGSSTIPYGRKTAPEKSKMWNILNAGLASKISGKKPARWPDLVAFSHVHYYGYAEDAFGASMTLPCWQAIGSRYGDEACDGHIDLGAVMLTVQPTKEESWAKEHRLYLANVVDRLEHR